MIADGVARVVLERVLAADVEANARVKFQRLAAGRGFGIAEHHADLFAQLIGENAGCLGLAEDGGKLAQRLAHEPGLQTDEAVAHLAFDLGARRERGHGVDRHDVERAAADEHLGDLERLLAVVGLGDQQVVDVDADGAGVVWVHGVLGVDEGPIEAGGGEGAGDFRRPVTLYGAAQDRLALGQPLADRRRDRAADDQGLVAVLREIALLYGRKKSIHVDMNDFAATVHRRLHGQIFAPAISAFPTSM